MRNFERGLSLIGNEHKQDHVSINGRLVILSLKNEFSDVCLLCYISCAIFQFVVLRSTHNSNSCICLMRKNEETWVRIETND